MAQSNLTAGNVSMVPSSMGASAGKSVQKISSANVAAQAHNVQSPSQRHHATFAGSRWFGQPLTQSPVTLTRKAHPQSTPRDVAEKIVAVALDNPIWGCCKLALVLREQNILISSPTVQKILIKEKMGSQRERAARLLERADAGRAISLNQKRQIDRILGNR